MEEKLKPLPKKITNEIREILESCRDGKLKHGQGYFHCGTAHCIAGWKAVLDFARETGDDSIHKANFDDLGVESRLRDFTEKNGGFYEDEYAQKQWRLTDEEAEGLFHFTRTFPEQFALLKKLEKGERIA